MRYTLEGLHCAGCAAEIERELQKIPGLENTVISFATKATTIPEDLEGQAQAVISALQPAVRLLPAAEHEHEHGPGCGHDHQHAYSDNLRPIIMSVLLLISGLLLGRHSPALRIALIISSYLTVGWPVLKLAAGNLLRGRMLDENFLMAIATVGAIAIGELTEAVAVMLFYALGQFFQDRAVDRSRRSISALMAIRPDQAHMKRGDQIVTVSPEEVPAGSEIIVRPGERVPLDGIIVSGESFVDTSALTGEPLPRRVQAEDEVLAGMVNGEALLTISTIRPYNLSAVARILQLVQEAESRKAPAEQFITTFARYYTPIVVALAAAVAVLPPLFIPQARFSQWLYHALVLLVISCPCAVVISVPLGYFGGIGNASRHGILAKGGNYLHALADLDTVVFDKTGTLTEGRFAVTEIIAADGFDDQQLLELAAKAEFFSTHPIAESLRRAVQLPPQSADDISDYRAIPGQGVTAVVNGQTVLAGNERLLQEHGISPGPGEGLEGAVVFVATDGQYAGRITLADRLKDTAQAAVAELRRLGVRQLALLTGDREAPARLVAEELGLDSYFAQLLPEDKVRQVERLLDQLQGQSRRLAFVGDGVNDAPVIARADVGVAMGGLGSDAAIEAADIILMEDDPAKLVTAIKIARHTRRVVTQNIVFSVLVKIVFLALGAVGLASIWQAVFADVGVALLAILNAARTLRYKAG